MTEEIDSMDNLRECSDSLRSIEELVSNLDKETKHLYRLFNEGSLRVGTSGLSDHMRLVRLRIFQLTEAVCSLGEHLDEYFE